jgi:hypothetical protein
MFLSGALWEEVRCTAKVVDGHSAVPGAQGHTTASSSWSTSLFPMCGSLEKSCILHTPIALAALLMMKTLLRQN